MFNSTYIAEYVADTQTVLLTDAVSNIDVLGMEFIAFRRMNRLVFGEVVAHRIEMAVCGYDKVVINWDKKKVAVKKPKTDLVNDFLQRALDPYTIQERQDVANDHLGGDLREYDRALLGLAHGDGIALRSLL